MRQRQGVSLLLVLQISILMFILALGVLTVQSRAYAQAHALQLSEQARALAEAGLEDALLKLERDPLFPPLMTPDQVEFTYHETLIRSDGTPAGSYRVTLDTSRQDAPYYLLRILARGRIGPDSAPLAERVLSLDIDLSAEDRTNPSQPNPRLWTVLHFHDWDGV